MRWICGVLPYLRMRVGASARTQARVVRRRQLSNESASAKRVGVSGRWAKAAAYQGDDVVAGVLAWYLVLGTCELTYAPRTGTW